MLYSGVNLPLVQSTVKPKQNGMHQVLESEAPTIIEIRDQLKDILDEHEYRRINESLRLIERDRTIRNAFSRLRRAGYQAKDAIIVLAEQAWDGQYLSEAWIEEIVYPRQRIQRSDNHS